VLAGVRVGVVVVVVGVVSVVVALVVGVEQRSHNFTASNRDLRARKEGGRGGRRRPIVGSGQGIPVCQARPLAAAPAHAPIGPALGDALSPVYGR